MGKKFKRKRRAPERVMERRADESEAKFEFRTYIRKCREERRMNQEGLAKDVRTSSSFIALIEAGSRAPKLEMVPKLAEVLHVNKAIVTKKALDAFYPGVYRALFGKKAVPELDTVPASDVVNLPVPMEDVDFCEKYPKLSRDMKAALHQVVDRLYRCQLKENKPAGQLPL